MSYIAIILFALGIVSAVAWLGASLRNIVRHRMELERADKQLAQYTVLRSKAQSDQEKALAQEQIEISQAIYRNVVLEYNLCLGKPLNLIPARILGYRPIAEGGRGM